MSESLAEQLARLIHADLVNNTSAGAGVERDREVAIGLSDQDVILIELGDEDTQTMGGSRGPLLGALQERNDLRLIVTVLVRGDNWQTRADALRNEAHQRIVTLHALRPLIAQIRRERAEWRPANTEQPFGYLSQVYVLTYLTNGLTLGPVA